MPLKPIYIFGPYNKYPVANSSMIFFYVLERKYLPVVVLKLIITLVSFFSEKYCPLIPDLPSTSVVRGSMSWTVLWSDGR